MSTRNTGFRAPTPAPPSRWRRALRALLLVLVPCTLFVFVLAALVISSIR